MQGWVVLGWEPQRPADRVMDRGTRARWHHSAPRAGACGYPGTVLGIPARGDARAGLGGHRGCAMAMLWLELFFLPCVDLGFCLQGARGEQGEKGSTGFPGARGPGGQKVRSWASLAASGVLGGVRGTIPFTCPDRCLCLPQGEVGASGEPGEPVRSRVSVPLPPHHGAEADLLSHCVLSCRASLAVMGSLEPGERRATWDPWACAAPRWVGPSAHQCSPSQDPCQLSKALTPLLILAGGPRHERRLRPRWGQGREGEWVPTGCHRSPDGAWRLRPFGSPPPAGRSREMAEAGAQPRGRGVGSPPLPAALG